MAVAQHSDFFEMSVSAREKCKQIVAATLQELAVAVSNDDFTVVLDIAHKLKGSAPLFGFSETARICADFNASFRQPLSQPLEREDVTSLSLVRKQVAEFFESLKASFEQ